MSNRALHLSRVFLLLLAAVLLLIAGSLTSRWGHSDRARLARMMQAGPPAAVPVETWLPPEPDGPVELNLRVRFLPEKNVQIVRQTRQGYAEGIYIFPFTDLGGAAGIARGAVILPAGVGARFLERQRASGSTLATLDGLVDRTAEALPLEAVLRRGGLDIVGRPLWVSPFLDGRDAGLAEALRAAPAPRLPALLRSAAIVLASLGLRELARLPLRRPARERAAAGRSAGPRRRGGRGIVPTVSGRGRRRPGLGARLRLLRDPLARR